ncbi:Histone-lysine N-methyltransferase SETMAR like protein [Argiope bruennichi]|uniref:Histone-lysine N-methyltransferase SETMAR like protein n=1 Tax=Argiope bruennichi TaxID=94029 RepID=A0A8T0E759_ARGBR|nr:Histone-lysine N-methyltransferase SETMAR like protein [Argiope bruennichi]
MWKGKDDQQRGAHQRGAASGRHYSQQSQSEHRTYCTYCNIHWQCPFHSPSPSGLPQIVFMMDSLFFEFRTQRFLRNPKMFAQSCENKRHERLSKDIVLLHDNARPYKASTTQNLLPSFGWEIWQHPPNSPDLMPCDFHAFGKLKEQLGGTQFSNDDQIQTAVLSLLQDQGTIFYRQYIERLVLRSYNCLQYLEDYV